MSPTASAPWALALAEWHQVCKFVLRLHALLHAFVLGLILTSWVDQQCAMHTVPSTNIILDVWKYVVCHVVCTAVACLFTFQEACLHASFHVVHCTSLVIVDCRFL